MSTRSNFLIHWTGKDLETNVEGLTTNVREQYVERLILTLRHGLWMTRPSESLVGRAGARVEYNSYMTCFTEIRLSQTQTHCRRYGLLGIGVDRRFVLDRWGAPVWYVRNRGNELVVNAMANLVRSRQEDDSSTLDTFVLSFLKGMSDPPEDGDEDFRYLEEHEWRIVGAGGRLKEKGYVVDTGAHPDETSPPPGRFRIPLKPTDLSLLVLPDKQTKVLALENEEINNWFGRPTDWPALLTVTECSNF